MFKHILLPTDGSQLSQDAVRRAVMFAQAAGARITAFYAMHEPEPPYFVEGREIDTTIWNRSGQSSELEASRILGFVEALCREAGVPCANRSATSNSPYQAIIEAAKENGCDLIFMASHGRSGIGALLLGSETSKVLAHSNIPVLVYR
jgi:nucleotide-binding universal stress UspA family protein